MTFVAIEGVIGVGKTTLARYLKEILDGTLVLEVFEENPFLSSFYQDRDRYAFQTQMFFLLSRYRQLQALDRMPRPIVSDYMFAKDTLFAHQTLRGDELMMYERVYAALSENAVHPDLVVYLRADTATLMERIAVRDRPYERGMDESYIDGLRIAYEHFFTNFDSDHLLRIDTGNLDYVHNEEDRREVIQRILSRLGKAPQQQTLPGLGNGEALPIEQVMTPLDEVPLAVSAEPATDLLVNVIRLQEEIGDLSREIRLQWMAGKSTEKNRIRAEMSDVFASLFSIAGSVGLESSELVNLASGIGQQSGGD